MAVPVVVESVGVGGTYATLAALKAALAVLDLTVLNQVRKIQYKNQTFTETALTFSGTVSDATRYVIHEPEPAGEHRFKRKGTHVNTRVVLTVGHTRYRRLRMGGVAGVGEFGIQIDATRIQLDGLYILDCGGRGIDVGGSATTSRVRNCAVVNCGDTGISVAVASCNTENCTALNNVTAGFAFPVAGGAARNLIACGNTTDFSSPANPSTKSRWISSDASAAGIANSFTGVPGSSVVMNATPGSEDPHLLPGSIAKDRGVNLAAQGFWWDGEGDQRPEGAAWDIGADESAESPRSTTAYLTDYKLVPANSTDVVVGPDGGRGDFLGLAIIIPLTNAPGEVAVRDGDEDPMPLFAGVPAGYVTSLELHPTPVRLGMRSRRGGWRATTGPDVQLLLVGGFR